MSSEIFNWIQSNEKQLNWVAKYLSTRIKPNSVAHSPYLSRRESLINNIIFYKSGSDLILFNAKMKAAWKQKKRRDSNKNKVVNLSIELNKNTHDRIIELAKKNNVPIAKVVNALLDNNFEHLCKYGHFNN